MNPAGNTSGTSWNNDLRQPLNQQGILADLKPSSPGPPRVAAVAHQQGQRLEGCLFAMNPAVPGGNDADYGQAPPFQEDPLHDLTREYMAFGEESADLPDLEVNRLLSDDYEVYDPEDLNIRAFMADYEATFPDTGADMLPPTGLAQEHPPEGESLGSAWSLGQLGAPPFGEALETSSNWAAMASGEESADLLDLEVNRLLSDDYEACDPEDPDIRAFMAGHEATFPNTGAAPQAGPAQEHPFEGESPGPGRTTGHVGAPLFDGALEALLDQTIMAPGEESADPFDLVMNRLLSDDYEAYDPEDPNIRAFMADYEAMFPDAGAAPQAGPAQEHSPEGESPGPGLTTGQIGAHAIGEACEAPSGRAGMASGGESAKQPARPLGDSDHARKKKRTRGDCVPMTADQRQAIVHIFETDPERSSRSIADELGVSGSTIRRLKTRFRKTGNIKPGDHANRLTGEQRQAIMHIFETDPERSNQSIADELDVSYYTIAASRKQFSKTGNITSGDYSKRLTGDQRQAIVHIFETDPKRTSQSITDELGVSLSTIKRLRKRFNKTGNLTPGAHSKRLTGDQRRAILHIFKTDPQRSNQSVAEEFGVTCLTIALSRRKFGKTGNIKPGDYANRLTGDQRRAILHIFETDPERNSMNIADEFDVNIKTIQGLKRKFRKTGNIKPGKYTNRLTDDQRRAILHIFETDPERSNQSIAFEFGVTYLTIFKSRRKFSKT